MKRVRVTTNRSNAIVRKGETVEIEWTPRTATLVEAGRLTLVGSPPAGDEEPTKDDLLAAAEAAGVHVAKSWTKDKIAQAIDGEEESA